MKTSFYLLLLAVVACSTAYAEKADNSKPMHIEADALQADDLKQISIATGKVIITKGTLVIRASRAEVRQDPEGYQYAIFTAEPGKRAFFRQKREGVNEFLEGESEVIDYNGKTDVVKFIRHAETRRFRGTALVDYSQGDLITYDNTNNLYTVNGGINSSAPAGRARTTLGPREETKQPGVPKDSKAQGTKLQPSNSLGSAPK